MKANSPEAVIERQFLSERMIGDRAYDCDPLDAQIRQRFGVKLIARGWE